MKILVTGGMGFIGSNLCSYLLNEGHEVIVFDSLVNPSINPTDRIKEQSGQNWANFKFYKVDIRDLNSMSSICANEKPEAIVHLAALGSIPRSYAHPDEVMQVNVNGFVNVMMLATMLNCNRVVFASSSSVYGDHPSKFRVEDNIGEPLNPYALSKRMNEQFAKIWCKNIKLKYVGLRFFNVYGIGQLPNSPYSAVIPRFINAQEAVIYGDGKTTRDFTYVEDVCEAINLSLKTDKTNEIYNVGTGQETSLEALALALNKPIKHIEERPADIKHSVAAPYKAQLFLKFTASYDIETGLEKTVKYYESLKNIHSL